MGYFLLALLILIAVFAFVGAFKWLISESREEKQSSSVSINITEHKD